jgi:arginyl-tRNA synthetase
MYVYIYIFMYLCIYVCVTYDIKYRRLAQLSRPEFQKIYDRLGITDLVERGESFYQSRMKDVVARLTAAGLVRVLCRWPS